MTTSALQKIVQTSLTTLFIFAMGCYGMKMKSLIAPKWVNSGENTKLVCDYDLGRDVMYSIKWFKDGHEDEHEVYRYIPTNQPVQYKSFKTPGVLVDEKLSKPNMLVILVTSPLGSGQYRCEVTTETPKFITLSANATVTVMTPPVNPPTIVGVESYYNPGDLVDINCTSVESNPAATLQWIVNEKKAHEGISLPTTVYHNETSGLKTAVSTLRFVAERKHFPTGRMQLSCMAKIEDLWEDKTAQVTYGAGDVSRPNHLLISNSAGSLQFTFLNVLFVIVIFIFVRQ